MIELIFYKESNPPIQDTSEYHFWIREKGADRWDLGEDTLYKIISGTDDNPYRSFQVIDYRNDEFAKNETLGEFSSYDEAFNYVIGHFSKFYKNDFMVRDYWNNRVIYQAKFEGKKV